MKRITFPIVAAFCALIACAMAYGASTTPKAAKYANVYFIGFDVDTITGYHEANIQRGGCKFLIEKSIFLKNLRPNTSKLRYDNLDIKALVLMSNVDRYFIDYNGIVRRGNRTYLIDKKIFERLLKSAEVCR